MNIVLAEPENWSDLGSLRDLLSLRMGVVVSFFLTLQGSSVSETPRDAINTDSSSGPFDTFAFEGPGRESSLYVVRINSLYTQTINSSMDCQPLERHGPASLDLLGSIQSLKHTNVFGFLFFFVCYSEKSFPENSQRASTLSSAQHLSPLTSKCQSGIKKPNRGSFERCHRGSK